MATYKTLLGSITTDAEVTYQSSDNSMMAYVHHYNGDPELNQMLQARDLSMSAGMTVGYNCDMEVRSLHYGEERRDSSVQLDNGHGMVIIFPSHPRYGEYPQPEQDIDPSGTRGKIIAEWDVNEVSKTIGDDIPF